MEIVAQRVFTPAYIYVDVAFLVLFCAALVWRRKFLTLIFALFGGVLYFVVDYGIFHLALHTRTIENGDMFWVLLWMSLSYGITNFAWIWLWISRDENILEWSLIICVWWIAAPLIASMFPTNTTILIQRTTGSYHGVMGLILFAGYAACIAYNLWQKERDRRFPLSYMLAIGILVQFAWEFALLIGGIRSAAISDWGAKITTLIVNSLVETNLGLPIIYPLYVLITSRFTEEGKRREKVAFTERMKELNEKKLRGV